MCVRARVCPFVCACVCKGAFVFTLVTVCNRACVRVCVCSCMLSHVRVFMRARVSADELACVCVPECGRS